MTPGLVKLRFVQRRPGLTLLEMLVVLVVFSIVSVGVGVGLQSAIRTPEGNDEALAISAELTSEMETWRAQAFGAAPWPSILPSSVSDTVVISVGGQGKNYSRATAIQKWDPNNLVANTSPQADFVRILITIGGRSLTAYVANPL